MKQLATCPLGQWESAGRSLPDDTGFAERETGPMFGRFGRKYVPEATPDSEDLSFAVLVDGEPVAVVSCRREGNHMAWSGAPVRIWPRSGMSDRLAAKTYQHAFRELERLAKAAGISTIRIAETIAGDRLTIMGKQAMNVGASPAVRHRAIVDLTRPESEIRAALRKSYRSLVNWGKRNLRLEYVNHGCPNPDLFDRFRQFHKKVAGRETRSARSWALQYDALAAGKGEAVLGYNADDDNLVSAALVLDGTREAVYFSGVYDRDQFDRPLGHWPLQDAIIRSKSRGLKRFLLGELPDTKSVSEKERSIAYFKRGFATDILQELVWEWHC